MLLLSPARDAVPTEEVMPSRPQNPCRAFFDEERIDVNFLSVVRVSCYHQFLVATYCPESLVLMLTDSSELDTGRWRKLDATN